MASTASNRRRTPEYIAWINARGRCHNPSNQQYDHYGARGIVVCPEWRDDFAAFLRDMGPRPSSEHTLDRWPDNDGPYAPGNCRWATWGEQNRNTSANTRIAFNGMVLCEAEWDERLGFRAGTVTQRISTYGWSIERALTEPVRKWTKRGASRSDAMSATV